MKTQITNLNFIDLDGVLLNFMYARELQQLNRSLLVKQVFEAFPEKKKMLDPVVDLGQEAVGGEESFTAALLKKLELPPDWAIRNNKNNYPLLRQHMKLIIKQNEDLDDKLRRLTEDCHHRNIIVSHNPYEYVRDAVDALGIGHRFENQDIIVLSDMGMMGKDTRQGQDYLEARFGKAYPRNLVRWNFIDDQLRNLRIPYDRSHNCCFVHPEQPKPNDPFHLYHTQVEETLDALAEAA